MHTEPAFRIILTGLVQGVGFRPFLYRLARTFALRGWVQNTGAGVVLHVEGLSFACMQEFLNAVQQGKPEAARIESCRIEEVASQSLPDFTIQASETQDISTFIPWDAAPCSDCLRELADPRDRRFQYAFISCSVCGPRFTILERLPFDRDHSAMRDFPLCDACDAEYRNPGDRRFHAQTISCPDCGPRLSLRFPESEGSRLSMSAIVKAVDCLKQGAIVAIKGIGGYQLAALADHGPALMRLRRRKGRPDKPLAVMFPTLAAVDRSCFLGEAERKALCSAAAPIVLLQRRPQHGMAAEVSGDLPLCGAMLPGSPLHWLLLQELNAPLVVTSANPPGAPMIRDDDASDLWPLAEAVLSHNRRIVHRADDSIVRVMGGMSCPLRRGRGMAPYLLTFPGARGFHLACGAEDKNCFALQKDERIIIGPHMGTLTTRETTDAWEGALQFFRQLFDVRPELAIHDAHPDYYSTHRASSLAPQSAALWHHEAHVWACLATENIPRKALALAWDGAGYGHRGKIHGGEGYLWDPDRQDLQHCASWLSFPWMGGDRFAREPRRCALALGHVLQGTALDPLFLEPFSLFERAALQQVLHGEKALPQSSSVGRLFDAVASLLNLRQRCSFEGEAALLLEGMTDPAADFQPYAICLSQEAEGMVWDWRPMLRDILASRRAGLEAVTIATRFHHSLVAAAETLLKSLKVDHLLLSGGVFQNRYLVESFQQRATQEGYQLWMSRDIPPNDAGLAAGQLAWFNRRKGPRSCV